MKVILDTNFISNNLDNCPDELKSCDEVCVPTLVRYELENLVNKEISLTKKGKLKLSKIADFFNNLTNISYININDNTIKKSNTIYHKLQAKRLTKKIHNEESQKEYNRRFNHIDNLIAGIALEYNMIIYTKDGHFNEFKSVQEDLLIKDN